MTTLCSYRQDQRFIQDFMRYNSKLILNDPKIFIFYRKFIIIITKHRFFNECKEYLFFSILTLRLDFLRK